MTVAPHLELIAEHDFARVARAIDDGNFAELTALIVNIVDQRAQRRDAQTARDKQNVVALHFFEWERSAERPANSNHVTALHFVQLFGELTCASHAQLDEALLGRRRRNGDGSFAHAKDGQLDELAGLLVKRFANALVNQAEFEELLGCGKLHDRRDARRPRTIGIFGHELSARFDMARCGERRYLDRSRESMPIRHWSPPFPAGRHARRAFSRQRISAPR